MKLGLWKIMKNCQEKAKDREGWVVGVGGAKHKSRSKPSRVGEVEKFRKRDIRKCECGLHRTIHTWRLQNQAEVRTPAHALPTGSASHYFPLNIHFCLPLSSSSPSIFGPLFHGLWCPFFHPIKRSPFHHRALFCVSESSLCKSLGWSALHVISDWRSSL